MEQEQTKVISRKRVVKKQEKPKDIVEEEEEEVKPKVISRNKPKYVSLPTITQEQHKELLSFVQLASYSFAEKSHDHLLLKNLNQDLLKFIKYETKMDWDFGMIFQHPNEMEELEEFYNSINIRNDNFFKNLKYKSLYDVINFCYSINPFQTFQMKKDLTSKDFLDTSLWCITYEDIIRISSTEYYFDDYNSMKWTLSRCIAQCINEGKKSYVLKHTYSYKNFYKINGEKVPVIEKFIETTVWDINKIEDVELSYYYEEEDEETGKVKKLKSSAKVSSVIKKINFQEYERYFENIERDQDGYFKDYKIPYNLNLFNGFKAKKVKAYTDIKKLEEKIPKIVKHIKETLCNKDEKCFKYFIQWLANLFLGIKTKTMIIFYSEKGGNGKSFFQDWIAKDVIGKQSSLFCSSQEDVASHFNSHLAGKSFILIDELKNTNDNQLQQLKNIITALDTLITRKGIDSKSESNYSNVLANTNDIEKLRIFDSGESNRRFYIIKTNDDVRDKDGYFNELEEEMKSKDTADIFYNWIILQYDKKFELAKPSHFNTSAVKSIRQESCIVYQFLMELKENRLSYNPQDFAGNVHKYEKLIILESTGEKTRLHNEEISSTDIYNVFSLINRGGLSQMAFSKTLAKYSHKVFKSKSKDVKESYPSDKLLLKYETSKSTYMFNPDYKEEQKEE